ncbi:SGNH/GDSL hydrolase family protein [Pseudomonas borbori]
MSSLRSWSWWLILLAALPLALPLALLTRRKTVRMPVAGGPQSGVAGAELAGTPLRLLVLGESTAAGVGVACQAHALVGQLAGALAARHNRPVRWRACGENGITAAQACRRLLPHVENEPADLVLLVFGVNDSTALSSLRRWREALSVMALHFSARGAQVVFSAVPPIRHFSALPWVLRWLLGARAQLLDRELQRIAPVLGASHCEVAVRFSADYLAPDGYHPSRLGYQLWAEGLSQAIILQSVPASPSCSPARP